MNSCILMVQIVSEPELRSTQDQTSVSTMMVEFESTKEGEDPGKVQVEGWGNLAEEIKNTYSAGDRVIVEGRLSMNLFEMPEGYKEKRAKLVASRVYPINGMMGNAASPQQSTNVVEFASAPQPQSQPQSQPANTYTAPANAPASTPEPEPQAAPASSGNEDWDEIPF